MRPICRLFPLFAALLVSGCGYVHFGRLPSVPRGDTALFEAHSNLSTEHKILKQELALVRKEGDALRLALERSAGRATTADSGDLVARLTDTSRELAALRASYAKLQAERSGPAGAAAGLAAATRAEFEITLAAAREKSDRLEEENTRLRSEVDRTRAENIRLAEQLKAATTQVEGTQLALAHLNADLLAQKEARNRAEQAAEAARAQLSTVLANASPVSSVDASLLQVAKSPPAGSSPTAELRVNTERLRATAASVSPPEPPSSPEPAAPKGKPARVHFVRAGDTLEKLALQYYGSPERWSVIYTANAALLSSGQPLRAGMELEIPEN